MIRKTRLCFWCTLAKANVQWDLEVLKEGFLSGQAIRHLFTQGNQPLPVISIGLAAHFDGPLKSRRITNKDTFDAGIGDEVVGDRVEDNFILEHEMVGWGRQNV